MAPTHDTKKIRALVATSSERLAVHFLQTPVALIEWNLDFEVVEWNPAAERLFGYSRDEAIGRHASLIVPEMEHPLVDRVWKALIESKGGERSTNRNITKDRRAVWCDWYNTPLFDDHGRVAAVLSQVEDITENKLREDAFHVRTNAIRTAINPVAIADLDDCINYANDACVRLWGYPDYRDVLGRYTREFWKDKDGLEAAVAEAEKSGGWKGELTGVKADGSIFDAEVSISIATNKEGVVLGRMTSFQDITGRKKAERHLREREELYRATFENAPVGVSHLDLEGRWLEVNQKLCEITGYSRGEMLRLSYRDITHPQDIGPDDAGVGLLIRGEIGSLNREKRYLRKDGTAVWVHIRTSLVCAGPGEPKHMVSVVSDISERKAAQEEIQRLNLSLEQRIGERTAELEEANKELKSFSYSVSHDLRAPLRAISGFSQALKTDCWDSLNESGRNYLSRVIAAGRRMDNLIEDMLALFRISENPLQRKRIDLGKMAREILDQLARNEPERSAEWSVTLPLDAEGDPGLLHAVLENLLGNAWKYTSKQHAAYIEFGSGLDEAGRTVYVVRDNGAGFDMKYADRLFKPFQRLHREVDFPGTGVGLATVQKIIRRHGGRIWAESVPGEGASFFFTLGEQGQGVPSGLDAYADRTPR